MVQRLAHSATFRFFSSASPLDQQNPPTGTVRFFGLSAGVLTSYRYEPAVFYRQLRERGSRQTFLKSTPGALGALSRSMTLVRTKKRCHMLANANRPFPGLYCFSSPAHLANLSASPALWPVPANLPVRSARAPRAANCFAPCSRVDLAGSRRWCLLCGCRTSGPQLPIPKEHRCYRRSPWSSPLNGMCSVGRSCVACHCYRGRFGTGALRFGGLNVNGHPKERCTWHEGSRSRSSRFRKSYCRPVCSRNGVARGRCAFCPRSRMS